MCEALLDQMPEMISYQAKGLFASTALHVAIAHKQRQVVELLLRKEAEIFLKNTGGVSLRKDALPLLTRKTEPEF